MFEFPGLGCSAESSVRKRRVAHASAVWRLTSFFIVVPNFMEIILVQLSDEARKIAMLEMFRENGLGELLVLFPWSD